MKTIKDRYKPFDFSSLKCYVITLKITNKQPLKIEHKLPFHIAILKGFYVTCNVKAAELAIGQVYLFFNEGMNKSVSLPVLNSSLSDHHSHPLPMNEEIKPNSLLQGVYYHRGIISTYPFTIKIYLHFLERGF